jgi:methylated-DNA-[protein]-cysteine S-methyltransferase
METIVSHIYHSPIGQLNITAEEGCITELVFVDSEDYVDYVDMETSLPKVIHQCVDELIQYFAGTRREFTVPINQEGTEFQQKVWRELYELSFGKTWSYSDLAKKLGDPKVIRAAAAANAKNKIAIIVPCHRIIGTDKSLVGYAWGKARKKWLLQHEFRLALGVQTLF